MPVSAFPVGKLHFLVGISLVYLGVELSSSGCTLRSLFLFFFSLFQCCLLLDSPIPTTLQDDMRLERRRCIQVISYFRIFTVKNVGCSWCALCCCSILCPHQIMLFQLWILKSLFVLSKLSCSSENSSSSSRKKMVFLNGNIVFKVLMAMLLKVPFEWAGWYFRKFSHFLANQKSWKCQVHLEIQWLVLTFAGNTIQHRKITSSRNRIKSSLSRRVALIF